MRHFRKFRKYLAAVISGIIFLIPTLKNVAIAKDTGKVTIKMGTLGPKGTSVTNVLEALNKDLLQNIAKNLGSEFNLIPYYGGVMGDDSQMLQKAQMGQLDMISPTVNAQPSISKKLEVPYMAYLIGNYGQFDKVTFEMKDFNDIFFEKGFVNISENTEGMHDLYLSNAWRTPETMRKNVKACNYTGGPDDTFFRAHGIPQVPIQPPEMFPSFKAGLSNAVILPSMFVIGMQIYTALPYIVEPSIRTSMTSAMFTKQAFDRIPEDMRIVILADTPLLHYTLNGALRDGAVAFTKAMVNYGSKMITLTPDELEAWRKPCLAYREGYLGNDQIKRATYEKITAALKGYDTSIEKAIFESDPSYASFPERQKRVANALETYIKTGSKEELGKLESGHVIEKWRLYDLIVASEEMIKTGKTDTFVAWLKNYRAKGEMEKYILPYQNDIKKLYGTKEALNQRLQEIVGYLRSPMYKGFQKK
jgi:TRAP-type C4-dicarboxylate transport system substrate-binding protein